MMFVLKSDITIGKFRFSGVNKVHIKKSLHSITDTATITLPSIARISTDGQVNPEQVITGKQFNDGDPVTIKLGYDYDLKTEFQGFVKRRDLNMPLEVTCEGYSWLLRRSKVSNFWKTIKIKDLLAEAVAGIDPQYKIKIQCDIDLELTNVNATNTNGFDLITEIGKHTDGAVSCFFLQPNTLWCGLVYTPYASGQDVLKGGHVSYQPGYNVIKDNSLKLRIPEQDPVQVKYNKKHANGNKISATSDAFKKFARTHSKILNQVKDATALKQLANEKAYRMNYTGYEGNINSFLQPYAAPGFKAYIKDGRYPEQNGTYLVESTEVTFGVNGARRSVEIGPRIGFKNESGNE